MLKFQKALLIVVLVGSIGGQAVQTFTGDRLVGLGCGPDHLTLTAMEEDEFPAPCYAIDTPQNMCGHDDAEDCAAYMGNGY